jgi:hypothetical protein
MKKEPIYLITQTVFAASKEDEGNLNYMNNLNGQKTKESKIPLKGNLGYNLSSLKYMSNSFEVKIIMNRKKTF